ncbi:hypothetical protein B0I72DRAFT_35819 [Yarrowia lipolytica]|uniref:Uncharacterized protein n=1 Tax=Yarrowia lipolytica TaxID=4952 RepID=A0A371CA11_YARLL|nr:hypothetical protein BKA91DRAFT_140744 [Yarrowia lipolytica]KAE8172994.1 hypothetical protein BKA90DRAFT_136382 [Yarrowia lipolytica]RDW27141.1 hypothetical protein B0I71DRAFT_129726 [Yarrowia lipolytica]RDW32670.1 hypothetical protein B0I72DRAFT_35819 [Yarrowia lipolytica]RDW38648.1 hypothetical protein B0I73DRAFT_42724 [Yarrowia lipolytica]
MIINIRVVEAVFVSPCLFLVCLVCLFFLSCSGYIPHCVSVASVASVSACLSVNQPISSLTIRLCLLYISFKPLNWALSIEVTDSLHHVPGRYRVSYSQL